MDADTVHKDMMDGVLPGIQLLPSGVWGVGRAQEHGCGYCWRIRLILKSEMSRKTFWTITAVFLVCILLGILFLPRMNKIKNAAKTSFTVQTYWNPPDTSNLPQDSMGNLIRYGRELIVHTAQLS